MSRKVSVLPNVRLVPIYTFTTPRCLMTGAISASGRRSPLESKPAAMVDAKRLTFRSLDRKAAPTEADALDPALSAIPPPTPHREAVYLVGVELLGHHTSSSGDIG